MGSEEFPNQMVKILSITIIDRRLKGDLVKWKAKP